MSRGVGQSHISKLCINVNRLDGLFRLSAPVPRGFCFHNIHLLWEGGQYGVASLFSVSLWPLFLSTFLISLHSSRGQEHRARGLAHWGLAGVSRREDYKLVVYDFWLRSRRDNTGRLSTMWGAIANGMRAGWPGW